MPLLTVAGSAVTRGRLTVPRVGPWHAEMWLDADTAPSGAVSLSWADGEAIWQGFVVPGRGGVYTTGGPAQVWLVGGAGGLSATLSGASYRNVTPRTVLTQILSSAGERLSGTSPAATLDGSLARWSRSAGTTAAQVTRLTDALGVLWRVLPDGSVYVGAEPGGTLTLGKEDSVTQRHPSLALTTVATSTPWTLTVGQTFEGAGIDQIVHHITSHRIRSDLWRKAA